MDSDPLQFASPELVEAVEAMGGDVFLAAIDEIVQANEESTVNWFDAEQDYLVAEEIIEWLIAKLARTGPTVAHAALEIVLRTYAVDEDDEEEAGDGTSVTAFVRVVLSPQIRADRYELGFRNLGEWIMHDAIRFVDDPGAGPAGPNG